MDSILDSVKKNLGLPSDHTEFDQDIILHINSIFAKLHQLGVGPQKAYAIEDSKEEWSEFAEEPELNLVKSYMYLEVRMLFDPPTGSVSSSYEEKIKEYEWRLLVAAEDLAKAAEG